MCCSGLMAGRQFDNYSNRGAVVRVCFALCDEKGLHIFDGTKESTIAERPRSDAGYGTDGIFIPHGWNKTWAEMNQEEQIETSVWRIGLKQVEVYLHTEN
jgi:inosine/xanthosine triphosphate pyrophosphatase family protein